jgi:hypothetical protein
MVLGWKIRTAKAAKVAKAVAESDSSQSKFMELPPCATGERGDVLNRAHG